MLNRIINYLLKPAAALVIALGSSFVTAESIPATPVWSWTYTGAAPSVRYTAVQAGMGQCLHQWPMTTGFDLGNGYAQQTLPGPEYPSGQTYFPHYQIRCWIVDANGSWVATGFTHIASVQINSCETGYSLNGTMCDPLPPCPTGEHYEGTTCVCDEGYFRAPSDHSRWANQCIREATGEDMSANPAWATSAQTLCGGTDYRLFTDGTGQPEAACGDMGTGEPNWAGMSALPPTCPPSTFVPPTGTGYYMVVPYPQNGSGC